MNTKAKLPALLLFALAAALRLEAQLPVINNPLAVDIFDAGGPGAQFSTPGSVAGLPPDTICVAFQGGTGVQSYGGVGTVVVGDFNGDGIVTTLVGAGDGTFSLAQPVNIFDALNLPDPSGGLYGIAVTVGDVNGDGLADIIGTTYTGGANDTGTVFLMNPDGSNRKAASLPSCPDGWDANGVCVDSAHDAVVTGGTAGPGGFGALDIFPGGPGSGLPPIENDFHNFDGNEPIGAVIPGPGFNVFVPGVVEKNGVKNKGVQANGTTFLIPLYGVTFFGGTNGNGPGTGGYGTVYTINNDGSGFQTLHVFSSQVASNGYGPAGGLALSGNTLYGTTSGGGSGNSGTLWRMDTSGSNFMVIKNFSAYGIQIVNNSYNYTNSDGTAPEGSLTLSGNTLYGTTLEGGTNGGGTVYSVSTNGSNFTVLRSFSNPTDNGTGVYTNIGGGSTRAGVVLIGHTLFGTTPSGGTYGGGTVFAIILPAPPSLNIVPSPGNFALSWRSSATNYMLQQNSDLTTTNWSSFGGTVSDDGTNKTVLVIPGKGNAFFRLLGTNGP